MTVKTAQRHALENFNNCYGRARRGQFFKVILSDIVILLATLPMTSILLWIVGFRNPNEVVTSSIKLVIGTLIVAITIGIWALTVVKELNLMVRRLHDIGRSGRWSLLVVIPIVGWVILLVMVLIPGNRGLNKYGSPITH